MESLTLHNRGWSLLGFKHKEHDYSQDYLTIVSLEDDNTISWKSDDSSDSTRTISISTNNGSTWTSKTSTKSGVTLATLNEGDKLLIKGSNYNYSTISCSIDVPDLSLMILRWSKFQSTKNFNIQGNIMSLVYNSSFKGKTNLDDNSVVFGTLFDSCSHLISAKNLILPATTLADYCYAAMFRNCTSLISAPELPATTLGALCYFYMFYGCTSLTVAPELPATTLAKYCYAYMFGCCTSLTAAPELPATTLAEYCYNGMFAGCTGLTSAPELPATTLANYCYPYMFRSCTSLTVAPELPATKLTAYCYYYMFWGCTSLNYIKCLATKISASYCTSYWVNGVAASGTFVKDASMTSWTTGTSGIHSGWITQNNGWYYGASLSSQVMNCLLDDNTIYTFPTITIDDPDITYTLSSSNTSVVSIENNQPNIIGIGSSTIMVTLQETNTNKYPGYGSLSYEVNVYNQNGMSYLTFTALENTTLTFSTNALQYSLDDGATWTTLAANTATPTISAGNKIMWKQTGLTPTSSNGIGKFSSTGNFEVSGNIMSLYYGDDFVGQTTNLSGKNYIFYKLFYNNTKLVSAENLILPATTLASYCYRGMFYNCTSLVKAPELPATTLATYCYADMFRNCTSLTTAPELPATTLATYCYAYMFRTCESLTTAPKLPATKLTTYCYYYMFYGCTNLSSIICLATSKSASNCTTKWVNGVAASGTFVKNASTTWSAGVNGRPSGWKVVNYILE